jgi:hypothetical protein
MFRGVFIFRLIAAADMSACKTQTQVNPGIAQFETFFAAARFGFYIVDLVEVSTNSHLLLHSGEMALSSCEREKLSNRKKNDGAQHRHFSFDLA